MTEYRYKSSLKFPHLQAREFKDVPAGDMPLRPLGGGKYVLRDTWALIGWAVSDTPGTSGHRLLFRDRLTHDKVFCYADGSTVSIRVEVQPDTYVSNIPPDQQ